MTEKISRNGSKIKLALSYYKNEKIKDPKKPHQEIQKELFDLFKGDKKSSKQKNDDSTSSSLYDNKKLSKKRSLDEEENTSLGWYLIDGLNANKLEKAIIIFKYWYASFKS